jgi:hypothetical protein
MDLIDRFAAAYERFIAEMEDAVSDPDMPQRAASAYNDYAGQLSDTWNEPAFLETNRLFETYRDVIRDGFVGAESAARVRDAYSAYLTEVKAALLEIDPATVTPSELQTIGQSLASLGWLAETGLDGQRVASGNGTEETRNEGQEGRLWGSVSLLENPSP